MAQQYRQTISPLEDVDTPSQLRDRRRAASPPLQPIPGSSRDPTGADGWGGRRSRGNQRGTADAGSGLSDAIPGSGGKFFATEVDFGDRPTPSSLPHVHPRRTSRSHTPGSDATPARKRLLKVEDVSFTLGSSPSPLPKSVPLQIIMENTVATLSLSTAANRRQWAELFNTPVCRDIIQDAFWFVFCTHCPGATSGRGVELHEASERLQDRLATNYARMFVKVPRDFKDTFLRHFFDALAQVMYNGFYFGFQGSRKAFSDDFKAMLITLCAEWTQGLRPHRTQHAHWKVMDTSAVRQKMRSRGTGALGPTLFEARKNETTRSSRGGGGRLGQSATGRSRTGMKKSKKKMNKKLDGTGADHLLSLPSRGRAEIARESMALQDGTERERVQYELSHSGLLKRYLQRRDHRPPGTAPAAGTRGYRGRRRGAGRLPPSRGSAPEYPEGKSPSAMRAARWRTDDAQQQQQPQQQPSHAELAQTVWGAQPYATAAAQADPMLGGRGSSRSRGNFGASGGEGPGAAALPPSRDSRRRRRGRRPRFGSSHSFRAPVSPFVARVTLTSDVGRPLAPNGIRKARSTPGYIAPSASGGRGAALATFADLVDASERSREMVRDEHEHQQDEAARELKLSRLVAASEQSDLRTRRDEALGGDVHEFSNYLVAMWALAEEKNKKTKKKGGGGGGGGAGGGAGAAGGAAAATGGSAVAS